MTKQQDCSLKEIMEKLQAPFSAKDIEWRVNNSGIKNGKKWAMVLAYVTNRAIQNRLDEVFGASGWKNEYKEFMQGILCTISCNFNGDWISKTDGAEQTQFESLKGGLSQAMKRASVQFGIGRYLYNLESIYVDVIDTRSSGANYINDKKAGVTGYWMTPTLPDWALPISERSNQSKTQTQRNASTTKNSNPNPPSKGQGFDRMGASTAIKTYLQNIKLNKGYIMPLFKKILPTMKHITPNDVFEKGTEVELRKIYQVVRPVNDIIAIANKHRVSIENVLYFVQILHPTTKIENLNSCFMLITRQELKDVEEMVVSELKRGGIKQIA